MANSTIIPLPRHSVAYQRFMLPAVSSGASLVITQFWAWNSVDVRYPIWELSLGSSILLRSTSHLALVAFLFDYYGLDCQ